MACQRSSGGSGSGFAQEGFELGEGLFDGIEVGGVGRQGARRLDGFTHALDLHSANRAGASREAKRVAAAGP